MDPQPIPEDIRRFVLTSIPSVPYLEALLLLHANPQQCWDSQGLSRRLYLSERLCAELLIELAATGIVARTGSTTESGEQYCLQPRSDELRLRLDGLAEAYGKNLVAIAELIHSKYDRKAQQFADAFKWRKEP